jgi:phytoene dehydrogenase-like protein
LRPHNQRRRCLHSSSSSSSRSTTGTTTTATNEEKQQHPEYSRGTLTPDTEIDTSIEYDAVFVGGGHNALTAAAYLAKDGMRVCVLERRHQLGGAACSEELSPGVVYSRAAYLFSLFRPVILRELELEKHGLVLYPRDPSSFTPLLDGRSLLLGSDGAANAREIGKFSARDAKLYPKYEEHIERLVKFIDPYLDAAPPDLSCPFSSLRKQLVPLAKVARNALRLGRDIGSFHEMLTGSAARLLNRWFESEPLKSTLATDAVIGAFVAVRSLLLVVLMLCT